LRGSYEVACRSAWRRDLNRQFEIEVRLGDCLASSSEEYPSYIIDVIRKVR
jgi:hypothetical protein